MEVLRWGGVFLQQKNPLTEPVEGSMYAKICRRFESLLDAALGGHEPTRDWRGGRKPVAPGNGVGRAPRNPGKPVAQRGGGRNLAKEWMVERLYAPSKWKLICVAFLKFWGNGGTFAERIYVFF